VLYCVDFTMKPELPPSEIKNEVSGALGIVVIGRNEGDRLKRCLESVCGVAERIVYVDSGSNDDSVPMSRSLGVTVVELDLRMPFTAARARNEGFHRLLSLQPALEYVFFVDGDCEVVRGWLDSGRRFLDHRREFAVVCGRRRERYPNKSVYNLLCDIEWSDNTIGETKYCGGDALMRAKAFQQVNGFCADLICGEEPELCVRLRQAGWKICRLDEDMTVHDAAMYRFSQWWRRMIRGGYAFAQGAALHGAPPERHWVRECNRAWLWGLWIPIVILAVALAVGWWALIVVAVYPFQVVRLRLRGTRSPRENWWRAGALVLSKFPEMIGQVKFKMNRLQRVQPQLIEYK
jgi:GT2 family glycosyltransferase